MTPEYQSRKLMNQTHPPIQTRLRTLLSQIYAYIFRVPIRCTAQHLYCMSLVPIYLCARICLLFIIPISGGNTWEFHIAALLEKFLQNGKANNIDKQTRALFSFQKGKMFAKKINAGCKRRWNGENRVFVYEHYVGNGNRIFVEMNRRVLSDKK